MASAGKGRGWLLAGLVLAAGCQGDGAGELDPDAGGLGRDADRLDPADPAEACGGERPNGLDDCFVGDDFADCGGMADPAFACSPDARDCRWLTGGCAPAGFVVSRCPPDDVCCRDDWPFPHDTFSDVPYGNASVYFDMYTKGPLPWDAERGARIELRVEPALEPASGEAECLEAPPEEYYYFCEEPYVYLSGATGDDDDVQTDDTVSMTFQYPGPSSDYLAVEVLPDGAGGHVARACIHLSNDSSDEQPRCPRYFDEIDPATSDPAEDCAVEGLVRLSGIPARGEPIEGLAGRVDVRFANGLRVRGGF